MFSSENISQRISNTSTPVLFIDTCVFFDILRSPFRESIHINAISSALNLMKLSDSNPNGVWLLTSETVKDEWNDNIENVKKELENEIKKQERIRKNLVTTANVILKIDHSHGQEMTILNLHGHLENLSRNFLNYCLVIKQEDSHSIKAMHRVQKCLAPAKKGKPEPKDCLVLEAFLDVSEKLRNLDYNQEIYFITSNSNDYGSPDKSLIIDDLNKVNATLLNSLSWAFSKVEISK